MTDFEKLKSVLNEFGVHYLQYEPDEEDDKYLIQIFKATDACDFTEDESQIINYDKDSDKVKGYPDFFTSFRFNKNEKFLYMGAWE